VGAGEEILSRGDVAAFWLPLSQILGAHDLRIANLECALTDVHRPIVKAGPAMRAAPACARGIRAGGFDVLTLANNHAFDMGAEGLANTLRACAEAGITTVGAGSDLEAASEPLVLVRGGIRLAIVNVAEREFGIAGRCSPGVAPVDPIRNAKQIARARDKADVVIAIVHGGLEYFALPRPGLVEYCRFLVDCGVHAVICHHTHVASSLEVYKSAPISYGVGNLLFDKGSRVPDSWHVGYFMSLDICARGVRAFRIIPFEQFRRVAGVVPLSEDQSYKLADRLAQLSRILACPDTLELKWRAFCRTRHARYLLMLRAPFHFRGMSSIFKRWPRLFRLLLPSSRRLELLNYMRCASHREAIETILEDIGRDDSPISGGAGSIAQSDESSTGANHKK
jgi:poly-gamma-glutamate synthesis protein (capsule biosynthesis protein)